MPRKKRPAVRWSAALLAASLVLMRPACGFSAPEATDPVNSLRSIDVVTQAKIDRDVRNVLASQHGAAVTIAIARGASILYARAYGVRDVAAGTPADTRTRYEIGSVTKQFTAAAILQLKESGRLSLDAPVSRYVRRVPHGSEITIRELLNHTSGLAEYLDGPDIDAAIARPTTFERLMARIAGKPLAFRPGSAYAYSNTNYIVLGRVIETVSGERWPQYAKRHLLSRAGMSSSGTIADEATMPDMARGYARKNGGRATSPTLDDSWAGAAGDLVSTVGDIARWDEALADGSIISAADVALLSTPPRLTNGSTSAYALGLVVDSFEGQPRIWHNGQSWGFSAANVAFPRQGVRIIVLANDADIPSDAIAGRIFNDAFPAIAAANEAPAAGEDRSVTARIASFITRFDEGRPDRAQMTPAANRAWSDAAVARVAARFRTKGNPAWIYRGMVNGSRGTVYRYILKYPSERLYLTVELERQTNKFAFFFVGRTDALWQTGNRG